MGVSRNEMLPGGIERYSRSAMYKKRGSFKKLGKPTPPKTETAATTKTKKIGGDKNGGTRVLPAQKAVCSGTVSTFSIHNWSKISTARRDATFVSRLRCDFVVDFVVDSVVV